MSANIQHTAGRSSREWLRSLAFWLCLFAAALLYALVALAPRVAVWWGLRETYSEGQWRLVHLERQVDRLRQVVALQQHDDRFRRAQAQAEFDVAPPGAQRIPVEPRLTLQILQPVSDVAAAQYVPRPCPQLVAAVAASHQLANGLLAAAGALVIVAFSCLYERRTTCG